MAGIVVLAVASAAHASVSAGINGKIVYGQVFPNYGITLNPTVPT